MAADPHSARAFDQVAPRYDAESTDDPVSRWVRHAVWDRLIRLFPSGAHVLELGCGTGEDAVFLAGRGVYVTATDASPTMLEITTRKAAAAGVESRLTVRLLDLAQAESWGLAAAAYDGVFSNYGPLNCIPDWRVLAAALAAAIRPGGVCAFAVMGRFCLWEALWHGLHGDFRTAARRWGGQANAQIGGVQFPVYYPTPGRLTREFAPHFRRTALRGLGVFLPPSDAYGVVGKRRRVAAALHRLERLAAPIPLTAYLADHFWIELKRR